MKPSDPRPGDTLLIRFGDDRQREAVFVRRVPAHAYQKAYSIMLCRDFSKINGPDDRGYFTLTDAEFLRRATRSTHPEKTQENSNE